MSRGACHFIWLQPTIIHWSMVGSSNMEFLQTWKNKSLHEQLWATEYQIKKTGAMVMITFVRK